MLPTLRRNVRSPFDTLREIDDAIGRAWQGDDNGGWGGVGSYPVDIHETDDDIVVEAEMPGFKRDEIEVTLEQGVLAINASRKTSEPKGEKHLSERRFTRVTRSFRLGQAVDENSVEAKLEDGLLTLTLHKREEVKPRKITVK